MSSDETEKQTKLVEELGFRFPSDQIDFTIGQGDYGIPPMSINQTIQGFSQETEKDRMAYNRKRGLLMMAMTHAKRALDDSKMAYNHALSTNNPNLAMYEQSLNESINQLNSTTSRLKEFLGRA